MTSRALRIGVAAWAMLVAGGGSADAGCGCDKAPPLPAALRPNAAYPGLPLTIFHAGLVAGERYVVSITAGGALATVEAVAETRRDLADGTPKPQLVVPLPELPLGPARVEVRAPSSPVPLLSTSDADLTVLPAPLALPAARGAWVFSGVQAAVSRGGVAYLALDLSGIHEPLVFRAQAAGWPLRFGAADVTFYNAQGFLMQLLMDGTGSKAAPIPGMFVQPAATPLADSDVLHYSRHEFVTYFLQHAERQPHAVDEAGWHVDGTPHIDHDHLVIAIRGREALVPGASPSFDLRVSADSIFHAGLVGIQRVELRDGAETDSYDPRTMETQAEGDVFSATEVQVRNEATVRGSVSAPKVTRDAKAAIDGAVTTLAADEVPTFMAVTVPAGVPSLGRIELKGGAQVITGPAAFRVDHVKLEDRSTLVIDNTAGPVTLYVAGELRIESGSELAVVDPSAERFALYVSGDRPVKLAGNGTLFAGVVYAPSSSIEITGSSEFSGAFVGKDVKVDKTARVHYDRTLRIPR